MERGRRGDDEEKWREEGEGMMRKKNGKRKDRG